MKHFVADLHFDTPNLIQGMGRHYPGTTDLFESVEEHDRFMLHCINAKVKRSDILYILGDFAKERPGYYRQQIKCKNVHLLLGNHDQREKCKRVFSVVNDLHTIKIGQHKCVLCHYPLAYWDGSHRGWWHLHGHTHGQRNKTLEEAFPERQMMDVSLDSIIEEFGTYYPIDEAQVASYMSKRLGHDQPSFYAPIQEERSRRFNITGDRNW